MEIDVIDILSIIIKFCPTDIYDIKSNIIMYSFGMLCNKFDLCKIKYLLKNEIASGNAMKSYQKIIEESKKFFAQEKLK